ncbi:hypothetical protein HG530_013894 [Fusarium avenaceum]|nr:hypothetical protein HG530_013894 [Fusarium avenaceum]
MQSRCAQGLPDQQTIQFESPEASDHAQEVGSEGQGTFNPDQISQVARASPCLFGTGSQTMDNPLLCDAISFLPSASEYSFNGQDSDAMQPFTFFPWPNLGMETLPSLALLAQSPDQPSASIMTHGVTPKTPSLGTYNVPLITTQSPQVVNGVSVQVQHANHLDTSDGLNTTSTLNATLDSILRSADDTVPSLSNLENYLQSLWHLFIGQIAPFLTPFGSHRDNPFLKYLAPQAEANPTLLTAVLYLAQIIANRACKDPPGPEGCFLERHAKNIQERLQRHPTPKPVDRDEEPVHETKETLLTFTTMLVFCMAFLASNNVTKLVLHGELAVILCQTLFKDLAEDEGFLYLVKLLGFILNALLFSSHTDMINAPDYLSAALECQELYDGVCDESEIDPANSNHFRDLDLFSGMSATMASIMYTLGSLVKRKKAAMQSTNMSSSEALRTFESDVDGLEVRLRRRLALINKGRDLPHMRNASQNLPDVSPTRCLIFFNEALFWSAWTIFWSDLRGQAPDCKSNNFDSAERIIDACAEIPKDSFIAPMILFPLIIGGMRTRKKVYREFVLSRLRGLENIGLTDTQSSCSDLEDWWNSERLANEPTSWSRVIF